MANIYWGLSSASVFMFSLSVSAQQRNLPGGQGSFRAARLRQCRLSTISSSSANTYNMSAVLWNVNMQYVLWQYPTRSHGVTYLFTSLVSGHHRSIRWKHEISAPPTKLYRFTFYKIKKSSINCCDNLKSQIWICAGLAWFTHQPWSWKQNVPPKRQWTWRRHIRGQVVRISPPTPWPLFSSIWDMVSWFQHYLTRTGRRLEKLHNLWSYQILLGLQNQKKMRGRTCSTNRRELKVGKPGRRALIMSGLA